MYTIRQFTAEDWPAYKAIRLKALATDPMVFSSNYTKEAAYVDEEWQRKLISSDRAVFGVYNGASLIGLTSIGFHHGDPIKQKAICWASWLEPGERGKKLSRLFYQARLDWAKSQPTVTVVETGCRASNIASEKANQHFGFVCTRINPECIWPDGTTDAEKIFELKI